MVLPSIYGDGGGAFFTDCFFASRVHCQHTMLAAQQVMQTRFGAVLYGFVACTLVKFNEVPPKLALYVLYMHVQILNL